MSLLDKQNTSEEMPAEEKRREEKSYLVVQKVDLLISDECYVPVPMSHFMASRSEALEWMTARGMQRDCKVMHKAIFKAKGGVV